MIKCAVCGSMLKDLSWHIRMSHGIDSQEYLRRYPGSLLVAPEVVAQRATNRDYVAARGATKATWEARYEGGHPMRDATVVASHLLARELNGNRYNHEAAKSSNNEKFGVDFHAQTAEHREVSRKTMTRLMAEGKIPKQEKTPCPDPEKLRALSTSGTKRSQMCREMGCSDHLIKNWLKDLGLPIADSRKVTDASGSEVDPLGKIRAVLSKHGNTTREFVSRLPKDDFPFHYSTVEKRYGSWGAFLTEAGIATNRDQLSAKERMACYLDECVKQGRLLTLKEYGTSFGGETHASAISNRLYTKSPHLRAELQQFFPSAQWVYAFLRKIPD